MKNTRAGMAPGIPERDVPAQVDPMSGNLLCPACGDTWLHHGNVTVYSREREDGDALTAVVSNRNVTSHVTPAAEVPGRRNSLETTFWCEICGRHGMRLQLIQHKGNTFLVWVDGGFDSPDEEEEEV